MAEEAEEADEAKEAMEETEKSEEVLSRGLELRQKEGRSCPYTPAKCTFEMSYLEQKRRCQARNRST